MIGAHAGDALLAQVRDADEAHRTLRDDAIALVARYGGTPVATDPEYALPFPVTDRSSALRLAVHLEEGAAAAWRYAVAATDDVDVRRTALTALTDAAVRPPAGGWLSPPRRRPSPSPATDARRPTPGDRPAAAPARRCSPPAVLPARPCSPPGRAPRPAARSGRRRHRLIVLLGGCRRSGLRRL